MTRPIPFYLVLLGALCAALAIGFGAFGAHALRDLLSESRLATWQTASHYLGVQGLGILLVALLPAPLPRAVVGLLLSSGVGIFSGSLYILCLSDWRAVAWLTPVGGLLMLTGWLTLAVAAWRHRRDLTAGLSRSHK